MWQGSQPSGAELGQCDGLGEPFAGLGLAGPNPASLDSVAGAAAGMAISSSAGLTGSSGTAGSGGSYSLFTDGCGPCGCGGCSGSVASGGNLGIEGLNQDHV